jgi:hypothetical protein
MLECKFMSLVSNYYVGKKAKSYKLNITDLDVIRHKATDKILKHLSTVKLKDNDVESTESKYPLEPQVKFYKIGGANAITQE